MQRPGLIVLMSLLLCGPVAAQGLLAQNNPAQNKSANDQPASQCLAMANALPGATFVSLRTAAADKGLVTITYAGHSTYVIETPGGVTVATDFSGHYTAGKSPDVVTMNRAHSTHYTLHPDPRIKHVLHGWNDNGDGPAKHALSVGDVFIRNVPTDIRGWRGGVEGVMQKDGNSIFIFEVAGLCIGHLGHLHHALNDTHYAAIGRLDIVMVPIDGSMTMSLAGMSEITQRLRSSIVLPMHRFGTPLEEFVGRMKGQFEMDMRAENAFTISLETLPKKPTVIMLSGV